MKDQQARWDAQDAMSQAQDAMSQVILLKKNITDIWEALELLGLKWEKGHSGRWVKREED